VRDHQTAQALALIRALRENLNEMSAQLAFIERKGAAAKSSSMVSATRLEAAALRRDMNEAQVLIDRLRSHYLTYDDHTERHPPRRHSRASVAQQAKRTYPWQH
jgi:hypothetical protein